MVKVWRRWAGIATKALTTVKELGANLNEWSVISYIYNAVMNCNLCRNSLHQAVAMGGSRPWAMGANESPCLDAERFKTIADDLVLEAGIRPLLNTIVVDTLVRHDSNTVIGVVIENKAGRAIIVADRVIDCTGDGDVAYQAGCRYTTLPLEDASVIELKYISSIHHHN